jgi:translation initiation factor IF-3
VSSRPNKHRQVCTAVVIATVDQDFGIVRCADALTVAEELARELNEVVYVRHPISDRIIRRIRPTC